MFKDNRAYPRDPFLSDNENIKKESLGNSQVWIGF